MSYPPLEVPAGIDDESSRAIVALLNARFDALPIERVLVWHVPSVQEDALPHLADTLGVSDIAYLDVPPRDVPAQGVAFMRTRGTGGALRRVLEAFFPDVTISTATKRYYDGSIKHDGIYTHGSDGHWAVFFVTVHVAAPITIDQVREVWDAITYMSSRRDRCVLFIHDTTTDETVVFRTSASIEALNGLGGGLPLSLGG